MSEVNDPIYNEVYSMLKGQIETDVEFKKEIQKLYYFYERKLMFHAKSEEAVILIREKLEDVVFSQYFQGYYIMSLILSDEETVLEDSVWSLERGVTRNEIPKFVVEVFSQEVVDWTTTELGHNFGMDVLQLIEPAFDIVKQLRIDLANYGAFKAFVADERYIGAPNDDPSNSLLGSVDDFEFLTPQVYMKAQFVTSTQEILDLYNWSSVNDNMWVGAATLSIINVEEHSIYFLEIKLANSISNDEKMDITNEIIGKLPVDIRELVQVRLYHIEDIEILVKNVELDV